MDACFMRQMGAGQCILKQSRKVIHDSEIEVAASDPPIVSGYSLLTPVLSCWKFTSVFSHWTESRKLHGLTGSFAQPCDEPCCMLRPLRGT